MKYRIVDADNKAEYSKPKTFEEVKAWFEPNAELEGEHDKWAEIQEKMDAIAVLMDDETREKVHHELAPCEPIEFLKRYCELEPSFEAVLKGEFSIEI